MKEKRMYVKPSQRVIELQQRTTLLTGSPLTASRNNPYGDPIAY